MGIVANNKLKILLFAMGMAILVSSPAFAAGVSINNGATYTWTTKVILYLTRPDVSYNKVAITNHLGYGGSGNITYSPTKEWTLEGGEGTKTVYVTFGNTSNQWTSNYSDTITIQFDRTAPTAPTNLQSGSFFGFPVTYFNSFSQKMVILGWNPSQDPVGTDGIPEIVSGVGSYLISLQGPSHAGFESVNTTFKWYDKGLSEGIYTAEVSAADRAGNPSPFSNQIMFYVDMTKPPKPTNVRAFYAGTPTDETSTGNFTISWEGVTDNPGGSGIKEYEVLIYPPGSTQYRTYVPTTATNYSFTNFWYNGDYHFHVRAVDNSYNYGDQSASFARVMIDKITPQATIAYFNGWQGNDQITLETSYIVGSSEIEDGDLEYKTGQIDSDGNYVLGGWLEYGGEDGKDLAVHAVHGEDNYAYQFRFRIKNGVGVWSSYSEPSSIVKIDVQDPEAPNITQPARDPEHPSGVAVKYDLPAEISGEARDVIHSAIIEDPKDWLTGGSGIAGVEIKIVSREGTDKYRFWEKTEGGVYRWSLVALDTKTWDGGDYGYGVVGVWHPVTSLTPRAYFKIDQNHYYDTWSLSSHLPSWDEGITYVIIARATDRVGKLSNVDYFTDPVEVKIDRTAPKSHVVTFTPDATKEATFTVRWMKDATSSPPDSYTIQSKEANAQGGVVSGWKDWKTNVTTLSADFSAVREGTYSFRSIAKKGPLVETDYTGLGDAWISYDHTSPEGSISIRNGPATTESRAYLTLNVTDNVSPTTEIKMQITGDVAIETGWINFWPDFDRALSGDGQKTISVQYRDKVGNTSSIYSDTIFRDTDDPDVLIIKTPPTGTVSNIPIITGEAHDAGSGVAKVEVKIRKPDSGQYRFWLNSGGWSDLKDQSYDGPEVWNLTTLTPGSPNDTWSFSLNPLPTWPAGDTDVRISAKATDRAGNKKTGVYRSVTVHPSTAGSYSVSLVAGKNWVSVPYINNYTDAKSFLLDINGNDGSGNPSSGPITSIVRLNPDDQKYESATYNGALGWIYDPGPNPFPMVEGDGYEITVGQNTPITLHGSHDPNFTFSMTYHPSIGNKHWISVPQESNYTNGRLLINSINGGNLVPGTAISITRLNPNNKQYESVTYNDFLGWLYDPDPNNPFLVVKGEAYEVTIKANTSWKPTTP